MARNDEIAKKLADQIEADICRTLFPPQPKRNTALAYRGGAFVTVEFDDSGKEIIPPSRCPHCGPILLCPKHMAMVS